MAAPDSGNPPSDQKPTVPTIALPKGGAAIRSMGEKFAANPVTGTGSMSVPIATSTGRSGFGPRLSLSYDSGSGNGPFGFGWSLSLRSITRKTDKGLPQYRDDEESDVFILSGAEDLVPAFKKDTAGQWVIANGQYVIDDQPRTVGGVTYDVRRYRPRIEGLFARIERWTRHSDGDMHWRSYTGDNVLTLYGKDSESRITDQGRPVRRSVAGPQLPTGRRIRRAEVEHIPDGRQVIDLVEGFHENRAGLRSISDPELTVVGDEESSTANVGDRARIRGTRSFDDVLYQRRAETVAVVAPQLHAGSSIPCREVQAATDPCERVGLRCLTCRGKSLDVFDQVGRGRSLRRKRTDKAAKKHTGR